MLKAMRLPALPVRENVRAGRGRGGASKYVVGFEEEGGVFEEEGGGVLGFRCRTASDSKKAHLADMADSVQMASAIGRVPANPDDGTEKTVITKAKFQVETGAPGKKFACYMRWYNTKHPKLASPWCGPFSIDIL